MNERRLLDRIVSHLAHLGLGIALVVVPVMAGAVGLPFDIDDTTARDVVIDIESSADPAIRGVDAGAVFPEDAAHQLVGSWSSDGTTGTITVTSADMEVLLDALVTDPGVLGFSSWTTTLSIDIATGDGDFLSFGKFDIGIPPLKDLTLHATTTGGPYLPIGIGGTAAGYEADSRAPGALLFCTDTTSFISSPGGCGTWNDGGDMTYNAAGWLIPVAYPYIDASGLIHMTGNSFPSTSSAPTYLEGADMRLTEVPEPGSLVMLTSGGILLLALRRRRATA